MSILKFPAEVLLEIFNSDILTPKDLKSLRLTHSAFYQSAGVRLFRTLSLHFEQKKSGDPRTKTTLLKRIQHLIDNGTSSDKKDFVAAGYRDVSILFKGINCRNGFTTFTARTARPFLGLFMGKGLDRLKVEYDRSATVHLGVDGEMYGPMNKGMRLFFQALQEGFEDGFVIKELVYLNTERFLPYLCSAVGVRKLHLDVVQYRYTDVKKETYEALARLLGVNTGLEELYLRYNTRAFPLEESYGDSMDLLDRVLDLVAVPIGIKRLTLRRIRPAQKQVNIAKLTKLEVLDVRELNTHDENMTWPLQQNIIPAGLMWRIMKSCGIKLKQIWYDALLTDGLVEYLGWNSGVERLGVKWDMYTQIIADRFYEISLPCISQSLTFLCFNAHASLTFNKSPVVFVNLSIPAIADKPELGAAGNVGGTCRKFCSLMGFIRTCSRLRTLKLKLLESPPSLDTGDRERLGYLSVGKRWSYSEPDDSELQGPGWNEGLLLKVKLTSNTLGPTRTVGKAVSVLKWDKGNGVWGFEERSCVLVE